MPIDVSAQQVATINVQITAFGKNARLVGSMAPVGLYHCGEVGLGTWSDDAYASDPPVVMFSEFIHHENEQLHVPQNNGAITQFYPSVFWRLNAGYTADIWVFW
jgi:hypothetical protein